MAYGISVKNKFDEVLFSDEKHLGIKRVAYGTTDIQYFDSATLSYSNRHKIPLPGGVNKSNALIFAKPVVDKKAAYEDPDYQHLVPWMQDENSVKHAAALRGFWPMAVHFNNDKTFSIIGPDNAIPYYDGVNQSTSQPQFDTLRTLNTSEQMYHADYGVDGVPNCRCYYEIWVSGVNPDYNPTVSTFSVSNQSTNMLGMGIMQSLYYVIGYGYVWFYSSVPLGTHKITGFRDSANSGLINSVQVTDWGTNSFFRAYTNGTNDLRRFDSADPPEFYYSGYVGTSRLMFVDFDSFMDRIFRKVYVQGYQFETNWRHSNPDDPYRNNLMGSRTTFRGVDGQDRNIIDCVWMEPEAIEPLDTIQGIVSISDGVEITDPGGSPITVDGFVRVNQPSSARNADTIKVTDSTGTLQEGDYQVLNVATDGSGFSLLNAETNSTPGVKADGSGVSMELTRRTFLEPRGYFVFSLEGTSLPNTDDIFNSLFIEGEGYDGGRTAQIFVRSEAQYVHEGLSSTLGAGVAWMEDEMRWGRPGVTSWIWELTQAQYDNMPRENTTSTVKVNQPGFVDYENLTAEERVSTDTTGFKIERPETDFIYGTRNLEIFNSTQEFFRIEQAGYNYLGIGGAVRRPRPTHMPYIDKNYIVPHRMYLENRSNSAQLEYMACLNGAASTVAIIQGGIHSSGQEMPFVSKEDGSPVDTLYPNTDNPYELTGGPGRDLLTGYWRAFVEFQYQDEEDIFAKVPSIIQVPRLAYVRYPYTDDELSPDSIWSITADQLAYEIQFQETIRFNPQVGVKTLSMIGKTV